MMKNRRIYCNACRVETNHKLITTQLRYISTSQIQNFEFVENVQLDEPLNLGDSEAAFVYNLWICQGCDTATLQEACTARSLIKDDGRQVSWTYDFHPKRMKDSWYRKPFGLPLKLNITYIEAVESFNAGLSTLCAIGLRALVEGICVDKGITDKIAWGLEKKIEKLAEHKYVPSNIAESLKSFKFIGDSAAHRLETLKIEDLRLAIEIIEGLINFLYSLDYKARYLFERVKP